jgi:two-component system LytT family response regulator
MENELPKGKFLRVQRSFIVNLQKIKAVEKNKIYIEHKKVIPIGEQYKESFQEFLGQSFIK